MNNYSEPRNTIELIRQLQEKGVPEAEYQIYFNRFLEAKARKAFIPLSGHFELTPLCNLDCKMCYVHLNSSQFGRNALLPVETWKSLMDQAKRLGMMNAFLTGGECLTYPGFDELYLYLYSTGIVPRILSNGVLIDSKRIAFFKKHPPKMIQVTLYGSSEEAYEKVTGHRVFQTVFENLRKLQEEKLPVKIALTPNKYMETGFRQLLEKVEQLDIPYNINANLILPRKETGRTMEDTSIDSYIELYKTRNEIGHKELSPIDPMELPDENHSGYKQFGLPCGAGRSAFGITYDGRLCSCLSFPEISANPLKHGFEAAWREINTAVLEYPRPEECGGCVYEPQCLKCIAMHKNAPQKGHCDPRICERTKKLIAAGFIPFSGTKDT